MKQLTWHHCCPNCSKDNINVIRALAIQSIMKLGLTKEEATKLCHSSS